MIFSGKKLLTLDLGSCWYLLKGYSRCYFLATRIYKIYNVDGVIERTLSDMDSSKVVRFLSAITSLNLPVDLCSSVRLTPTELSFYFFLSKNDTYARDNLHYAFQ